MLVLQVYLGFNTIEFSAIIMQVKVHFYLATKPEVEGFRALPQNLRLVTITHLHFCFHAEEPGICAVRLIGDGVTVNGDTATVQFAGVGPSNSFLCSLDRQNFIQCEFIPKLISYQIFRNGLECSEAFQG